jgi:hypothetical protein
LAAGRAWDHGADLAMKAVVRQIVDRYLGRSYYDGAYEPRAGRWAGCRKIRRQIAIGAAVVQRPGGVDR